MTDALERLQNWYLAQCDGDWEHQCGVKIDNVDNPGWSLLIDLTGTPLEEHPFETVSRLEDSSEWLHCKRTATHFKGSGGPLMLGELIGVFLLWAESAPT